jgi:hypothetical protein
MYNYLFLNIIHCPVSYLKRRFRDWTLSPSLHRSLLNGAQSIELIPFFGQQSQCKTGYINQTQHNPSAGVKTNITKLHTRGLAHTTMHNCKARVHKVRIFSKYKPALK